MSFDEIGKMEPAGKIFLYDTRSTPGINGRYICLSYCWGSHLPLRTLKANLPDMEKTIPWKRLPKTFQDAIHLTKLLGISYLWIDALCIVQDDPADWDREASQMSTIYSDSYLTVTATFAENSDSGCYTLLEANTAQQHQLFGANGTVFVRPTRHATSIDMSDDTYVSGITQIPVDPASVDHESSKLCRTPLMTRAWPLQEYLLPCRILQFGP
jgi:Heterokaryon incompatibility protein (HET)